MQRKILFTHCKAFKTQSTQFLQSRIKFRAQPHTPNIIEIVSSHASSKNDTIYIVLTQYISLPKF